jgi:hypothetical protein
LALEDSRVRAAGVETWLSTSDQYLALAVDFAAVRADKLCKSKQDLRVALAMEDEPFAQDVRAGALESVVRHGMKIVINDQLPPGLDDMSGTLAKVRALQPDLLLISGQEQGSPVASAFSLERVAGVDCRLAGARRLLEQRAGLCRFGGAAEGPGDQPPFFVRGEHAARLKSRDQRGMVGQELAP